MDNYMTRGDERWARRLPSVLCERQNTTELSSDIALSDYQPEILRLLRIRATVLPPDTYIGASGVELSGTVEYFILYCGRDGALYSASHTEEYRFSTPCEFPSDMIAEEGIVCDADCVAENPVCRVAGPRKLSVRCRLRSNLRLWGTRLPEENEEGINDGKCERLRGSLESMRCFVGVSEPVLLADEILLDGSENDLRVIGAEGEVFVTDAEAASGSVSCRGEVILRLLCCHESTPQSPVVNLRKIPFATSVITDGVEVNCDCCAHGVCRDIQITVEDGRILCEVGMILTTRAQRNESATYTKDLYSTSVQNENSYRELPYRSAIRCLNGNFSFSTSYPYAELGLRSEQNVLDAVASATVRAVEEEHGRTYLTGVCRCQLLLSVNGELSTEEFEAPFRYETESEGNSISGYDAHANVISCRVRADGERVALDAEIAVSAALWSEGSVKMLSKVSFGETLESGKRNGYTVCYPSAEDTLWSVAKRYHEPTESISARNGLAGAPSADSPESLDGIVYLLV